MPTITITTKERELLDLLLRSITHQVRYHNQTKGTLRFNGIQTTWTPDHTTIEIDRPSGRPAGSP